MVESTQIYSSQLVILHGFVEWFTSSCLGPAEAKEPKRACLKNLTVHNIEAGQLRQGNEPRTMTFFITGRPLNRDPPPSFDSSLLFQSRLEKLNPNLSSTLA